MNQSDVKCFIVLCDSNISTRSQWAEECSQRQHFTRREREREREKEGEDWTEGREGVVVTTSREGRVHKCFVRFGDL